MTLQDSTFYIGIDVGSVSIKTCLISRQSNSEIIQNLQKKYPALFENEYYFYEQNGASFIILVSKYRRIKGEPLRTAIELITPVIENLPNQANIQMSVTGAGGKLIAQNLKIPFQNEFLAIARGIGALHPDIRTVLEMGGDSSKYIRLDNQSGVTGILDYEINGDCAAGTGSFIDQQASRLLYEIEDVGDEAP